MVGTPNLSAAQITSDASGRVLELTFDRNVVAGSGAATVTATRLFGLSAGRTISTVGSPTIVGAVATFNLREGKPVHDGESGVSVAVPLGLVLDADDNSQSAASSTSVTNNSPKSYAPSVRLVDMKERDVSGTITIEAESLGHYGVSQVVFSATDGSTTVTQTVTGRTRSALDSWPLYIGTLDLTSLNDGAVTITATSTCAGTGGTRADSYTHYNNSGGTLSRPSYYCDIVSGSDTTGNGTEANPYQHAGRCFRAARDNSDATCNVVILSDGNYNLQEGSSGLTFNNTRPVRVIRGGAATKNGVVIIDDGIATIRKACSGDVHVESVSIRLISTADNENLAQIALNGIMYDCRFFGQHASIATNNGGTSWVAASASGDVTAISCGLTDVLKGYPSFYGLRNNTGARIASDFITNVSGFAINLECTDRGTGRDAFTVEWTGTGTGTVTKVDDTLTLVANSITTNIDLVTNNTVSQVVSQINAVTDWTATTLFNGITIDDAESFFDFSVDASTEQTIQIRNPDHSDLLQMHSGTYTNVIVNGIRERFTAPAEPGVSNDLQAFWFDHANFVSNSFHCANVSSITQEDGFNRSGLHGPQTDFMLLNFTSDKNFNLINRPGTTDLIPDNVYVSNSVCKSIDLENFASGNIVDVDEFYLGNFHFAQAGDVVAGDLLGSLTIGALSSEFASISYNSFTLTPINNLVGVASNDDELSDNFGNLRSASTALGGQRAATETGNYGGAATVPDGFREGNWVLENLQGDGELVIRINSLPDDGGSAITDLERRIDGVSWVSLGGTALGDYTLTGLTNGTPYDIEIRQVNSVGNSDDGDVKTQTPTVAGTAATAVDNQGTASLTYGTTPAPNYGADSQVGICSFWINPNVAWGSSLIFDSRGTSGRTLLEFRTVSSNRMSFTIRDVSTNTVIATGTTAVNTFTVGAWHHVLLAWDLSAPSYDLYINDAPASFSSSPAPSVGTAQWSTGNRFGLCSTVTGGSIPDISIAQFYLNTQQTTDITNTTNRRNFVAAGPQLADFGANGSTPTGTQPHFFFNNSASTFNTNLGSGGGVNLNGTFIDTTPPAGGTSTKEIDIATGNNVAASGEVSSAKTTSSAVTGNASAAAELTAIKETDAQVQGDVTANAEIAAGRSVNAGVQADTTVDGNSITVKVINVGVTSGVTASAEVQANAPGEVQVTGDATVDGETAVNRTGNVAEQGDSSAAAETTTQKVINVSVTAGITASGEVDVTNPLDVVVTAPATVDGETVTTKTVDVSVTSGVTALGIATAGAGVNVTGEASVGGQVATSKQVATTVTGAATVTAETDTFKIASASVTSQATVDGESSTDAERDISVTSTVTANGETAVAKVMGVQVTSDATVTADVQVIIGGSEVPAIDAGDVVTLDFVFDVVTLR